MDADTNDKDGIRTSPTFADVHEKVKSGSKNERRF